eukprot:10396515-Alexandrium_andersonii.AAC.1
MSASLVGSEMCIRDRAALPSSGFTGADVPADATASDDSRGVVRNMNAALEEHPEVSASKRSCSPSPAQLVGR